MSSEDDMTYSVVVNEEEQYSIWPHWSAPPAGWRAVGKSGSRQECLDHIDQIWTDMRPLSLRRRMEELAANPQNLEAVPAAEEEEEMSLVALLNDGQHPLRIAARPRATAAALKQAIETGTVLVCFTDTQGETELAVALERSACDLSAGDFDAARGTVRLTGSLVLDGEPVTCRAEVDLSTLTGSGGLSVRS